MNLTNIAEHRIKLLLKKSEGRATESDFKARGQIRGADEKNKCRFCSIGRR